MRSTYSITGDVVIRERQIEDILATYPDLLAQLLDVKPPLHVIARQMELPDGGRIDLLCTAEGRLLLIELKVGSAGEDAVSQLERYAEQLRYMQKQGALPKGDLHRYLLATLIPEGVGTLCIKQGIHPVRYDPRYILSHFFSRFWGRMTVLEVKPRNHGVWHLGVVNPILQTLAQEDAIEMQVLSERTSLSSSTVKSYLTLASQLGIVECGKAGRSRTVYQLTPLGRSYQERIEKGKRVVSENQAALLRRHILNQPFASGAISGIATIVESVLVLARNSHPVPLGTLSDYFTLSVGNQKRWNQPKTRQDATRMYVEYAAQIGLLARIGDRVYLTPEGVRFALLLQLHKAIHLLDAIDLPSP